MKIGQRIQAAVRVLFGQSGTYNPAQWFVDWIRGDLASDSGIAVDGRTILRYAPVWYAVNKCAGLLGTLPLVLHQQLAPRQKERAVGHPAYRLMKRAPNTLMTPAVFKELLQYHALIEGNGRAAIYRDRFGAPSELIPLLPDRTVTVLVNGEKWHVTKVPLDQADGRERWEDRKLRDRDVLHIAGLGYDGLAGFPLHEFAKNSIGLGLAAEKHGNRLFRSAAPGLILEAPEGILEDEKEAADFLRMFREAHEGMDNAGKTGLLRHGMKANRVAMSATDSQHIDNRRFQRQDAALWFLLESILGDGEGSSYNSLEQRNLAWLSSGLGRWLVKWEEECNRKLLSQQEQDDETHFFKFVTAALLRTDTRTTYANLAIGIRNRILSVNDARDILDMNAIEGGDSYENPAITPGGTGGDAGEESTATQDGQEAASARLRRVVESSLSHMVGVEMKRVDQAAAKKAGSELVAWAEDFYARFQETLREAIERCGGDPGLAEQWCGDSLRQLTESIEQTGGIDQWAAGLDIRSQFLVDQVLGAGELTSMAA